MYASNEMTQMNVLDLFCGCGGMSTGFMQAGFNVVSALDIWKSATDTYKANHPETQVYTGDITKKEPKDLIGDHAIDVIVGGPPCQGFSIAGRRDKNDPRNSLFIQFIRMVDKIRPKLVLMENVQGILSMKTEEGVYVKDIILDEYRKIGYDVIYQTLNAADYEVPQARKRVFFMAKCQDDESIQLSFPDKVTTHHIPVSTVLIERENVPEKSFLSERALEGIRRKREASKAKGHGFGAQIMDITKPSYTIPARYWKDGYDALVKYDDNCVRRLVQAELSAIQTFPPDYKWEGSKKDIIMQIGNAVPCRLAYHIANHLRKIIEDIDNIYDVLNENML